MVGHPSLIVSYALNAVRDSYQDVVERGLVNGQLVRSDVAKPHPHGIHPHRCHPDLRAGGERAEDLDSCT
jgi:hypothetical protein